MEKADIIIIGAGSVGCAIARELSRYELNILVLEKECDVAYGTSGRNSAVVHAGFNNKPGSLMAKLCVEGNHGFEQLARDLGVPYKKTGKVLVAFDNDDLDRLKGLICQGEANGCTGLRMINKDELKEIAPGINGIGGMYSPETAIFDPFEYCIALAENAYVNGVKFKFNSEVISIKKTDDMFLIRTAGVTYSSHCVVNATGMYSADISSMAGIDNYRIYPCRGEYFILDKVADNILDIPAYPVPKPGIGGLGVHITPTIDGNLIIGPSAEYIDEPDDYASTSKVMNKLWNEATEFLPELNRKHVIGNYSGIRPKQAPPTEGGFRDFVIKDEDKLPGFINLIGIESPGLTASVPIAKMIVDIIRNHEELKEKSDFISKREPRIRFRDLSFEEQEKLIKEDPEYGEIICRCQLVTKKEIRDAIENVFGARSISSIKYRAWATTGRCNGGYCLSKIIEILVNEYCLPPEEITYRSSDSRMLAGRTNDG